MSFFGFNTSGPGHNKAAPGFSQAHNPFAGLSHRDDEGEALDFEDTYDGLGDQLEETGDDLNDDTFGGDDGPTTQTKVGKDFDFFGKTAQVSNVIEEEAIRFARQNPASKVAQPAPAPAAQPSYNSYGYQQQQYQPQQQRQYQAPVRTGYEKYKEEPPVDDLQVDLSLWGVAPKKPSAPAAPAQPSRKILSLEEVEAQMRAQAKSTPQPAVQTTAPVPTPPGMQQQQQYQQQLQHQQQQFHQPQHGFNNGYQQQFHHMPQPQSHLPQQYPPVQPVQHVQHVQQQPVQNETRRSQEAAREPAPSHAHGHPVQILQRPMSKQAHVPTPSAPSPLHRQQIQQPQPTGSPAAIPPHQQVQHQAHPSQSQHMHPTQILQNPNRLSGEHGRPSPLQQPQIPHVAPPVHPVHPAHPGHPVHPAHPVHKQQQQPFPQQPQGPAHPQQLAQLSDEDKAAFLENEAKRAKRNHKIFTMSKDNGIMTPQDKNFITRIQLQQLVSTTGNPNELGTDESLAEDFYYQVHSQIQGGHRQHPSQPLNNFAQTYLFQTGSRQGGMRRHNRGGDNHMQRMEQQVQRAVEAAKNKPKNKQLVIEGSLGKISFSNAKTPKPLLNIKRTESSGDVPRPSPASKTQTGASGLSRKDALRSIEVVYDTLMKMEDHERWRPPPPASETDQDAVAKIIHWDEERGRLNAKLWKALKVHESMHLYPVHPFIALLSFSKAKKAMPRIFRHTTHEQRLTILSLIVLSLDTLDVVRGAQVHSTNEMRLSSAMRENIELFSSSVMSTLFNFLAELELDIVTAILGIVCSRDVGVIAKSKIGASMLTMILSRAEIMKQNSEGNEQMWHLWDAQYTHFFNFLEPHLPYIFPGTVMTGEDIYVWQFLAAIGIGAGLDQQQRLVLAVKDRVMDTVNLSKNLPAELAAPRLQNVNLFMHSIGLDVELLA